MLAEFESHLIKYATDWEALDQDGTSSWSRRTGSKKNAKPSICRCALQRRQPPRRTAAFDRHSNLLLDQEVELDPLKRRYMDKIRNYQVLSVDLKQCEDRYFAHLDYRHILTKETEAFRIHNEATGRVLREEWNNVEDTFGGARINSSGLPNCAVGLVRMFWTSLSLC